MVVQQLRGRGIGDERILNAFAAVPRELFVPKEYRDLSYVDGPVPIGGGQTISQPYTVAVMTEALDPRPSDRVLEIGTGSGYQAAILAKLVSRVYSVERIESLGRRAEKVWRELGIENCELRVGDGTKGRLDFASEEIEESGAPRQGRDPGSGSDNGGLPGPISEEGVKKARFDKIIITAATAKVPQALFDQLKVGGILVAPVGPPAVQELVRYTKKETGLNQEFLGAYRFVPLIGA